MSRKILYLNANPKTENESFGLQVGRSFLDAYKIKNVDHEIIELNLFDTEVPFLNASVFEAFGEIQNGASFEDLTEAQQIQLKKLNDLQEQFMDVDAYVIVNPMWNFSIPPVLKAYVDVILQVGKTFQYTEDGPKGLLKNKKALHIQASGGIYSNGDAKEFEFGHRYLKTVMAFIGIFDFELLPVEGIAMGQSEVSEILSLAQTKAKEIAGSF
ncbi:FMN-dependent NADH-azoreductase [Ancylomarina longa]|uniref:FMN dependent NADH:quinone oxidoreductase n=1 Tax=Ancylomarina longa TaxID=2487017 RepID=A0A434AX93_9BACT|nr:NAD(P)H-dependent oxidoreductase [Ancylomarina longa]RUT79156.1 FMN-dependent NADH-azoreductase [Ancylomarina longa]